MKRIAFATAAFISIAFCAFPMRALADGSAGPVYYQNGDSAVATDGCGPGDYCATVTLAGGDTIKVLTADQLDRVWSTPTDRAADSNGTFGGSKCGSFRNTHMMLDGAAIDMGIFQKKDGTVFVLFSGGSLTPSKP